MNFRMSIRVSRKAILPAEPDSEEEEISTGCLVIVIHC